jgi:hypothetical protein
MFVTIACRRAGSGRAACDSGWDVVASKVLLLLYMCSPTLSQFILQGWGQPVFLALSHAGCAAIGLQVTTRREKRNEHQCCGGVNRSIATRVVALIVPNLLSLQEATAVDSSFGRRVFPRDYPETVACGK